MIDPYHGPIHGQKYVQSLRCYHMGLNFGKDCICKREYWQCQRFDYETVFLFRTSRAIETNMVNVRFEPRIATFIDIHIGCKLNLQPTDLIGRFAELIEYQPGLAG